MQGRHHSHVHATLHHQVVRNDRVLLPLPAQPGVRLLVKLQRPVGIAVPHDMVAPCLEVEAITAGGRVGQ